ncbi:MAG: hypothetical protein U0414_06330 [Polyangiaceae bacterium]
MGALALYVVQRTGLAHPLHHPLARFFRPAFGACALVGGVAGWLRAHRRRPSDEVVAMFLDERFGAEEAITTAIGARGEAPHDALSAVVVKRATTALERAEPGALALRPVQRRHATGPLLAGALVVIALLPVAPKPVPPPAPGTEPVTVTDVRGLDKMIDVASKIDPRDEAQRERLEKLLAEAKALREKARAGAPQREIQAEVAKLADAIAKERMSLGDGEERAGFEAAMRALKESADLGAAAKALGDHDLAAFDQEMQRLANQKEKESRDKAKATLERAADAARKAGAENVAKALEDQVKKFDQSGERRDELKALGDALKDAGQGDKLGEKGNAAQKGMEQLGDPKAAQALADAIEKALRKMTDEEKKRLAENLKKLAQQAEKSGAPNADQLKKLAEQAEVDPEALAKQLEELAKKDLTSEEGRRDKKLGEAGDDLGAPLPGGGPGKTERGNSPGSGNGSGNNGPGNNGPGNNGPGNNGPGNNGPGNDGPGNGSGNGDGPGDPGGDSEPGASNKTPGDPTKKIDGGDLRSKADVKPGVGTSTGSTHTTRTGSRPGDTANRVGTGALGNAAPDEIGGVNRSDVPQEYRAHVGRYFQN